MAAHLATVYVRPDTYVGPTAPPPPLPPAGDAGQPDEAMPLQAQPSGGLDSGEAPTRATHPPVVPHGTPPAAAGGAPSLPPLPRSSTGPIDADDEVESDEEVPVEALRKPEGEGKAGSAPAMRWGRELPADVRMGGKLRYAIGRLSLTEYQLYEMVWVEGDVAPDGTKMRGWWRDRPVGEAGGFDEVEGMLLDRTVEVMSP